MSFIVFIIIGGLFAFLIIKSLLNKYPQSKEDPFSDLREETEIADDDVNLKFDEDYFTRCQNGEAYQLFMKLASINDCVFLQGLLASSGIPSHVEHQHTNGLFGTGANVLSGTFAAQLWILTADYDNAYEIAVQYVVQKSKDLEDTEDSKLKENIMTILAALTAPYPITKSQQILGITIFPKQQEMSKTAH